MDSGRETGLNWPGYMHFAPSLQSLQLFSSFAEVTVSLIVTGLNMQIEGYYCHQNSRCEGRKNLGIFIFLIIGPMIVLQLSNAAALTCR